MKYILATLALWLFGGIADVPIMFLAIQGVLSLTFVIIVGFFLDIFSDIFFYWVGGKIGTERFFRMRLFRQKPERVEKITKAIHKHGGKMLFGSKFTLGLGIPTQIIAGAHRYNFRKFCITNSIASASWLLVLYTIAKLLGSETVAERFLKDVRLAFSLFLVVIILLNYLISTKFKKAVNINNHELLEQSK